MSTRTRWTPVQARKMMKEFEESGLSMAEFARRGGFQAERLRRWRLRLEPSKAEPVPRLVELVSRAAPTVGGLRVRCPSGHLIEVDGVELAEGLSAVLSAIGRVPTC